MHSRGSTATMASYTDAAYESVTSEVVRELGAAVTLAQERGVTREQLVVDPGFGFSKRPEHNYRILAELPAVAGLGFPVMVGPSRKRSLGAATGKGVAARDQATAAACAAAYLLGAQLFRVHAVDLVRDALSVAHAVRSA
jgi:dihydropteroate synthase